MSRTRIKEAHLLVEYFLRVWSLAWAGPNGLIRAKRQSSEYTANVPPGMRTAAVENALEALAADSGKLHRCQSWRAWARAQGSLQRAHPRRDRWRSER